MNKFMAVVAVVSFVTAILVVSLDVHGQPSLLPH